VIVPKASFTHGTAPLDRLGYLDVRYWTIPQDAVCRPVSSGTVRCRAVCERSLTARPIKSRLLKTDPCSFK